MAELEGFEDLKGFPPPRKEPLLRDGLRLSYVRTSFVEWDSGHGEIEVSMEPGECGHVPWAVMINNAAEVSMARLTGDCVVCLLDDEPEPEPR